MKTLLGGEPLSGAEDKALKRQRELADEAVEVAKLILQEWFDAYSNGEITFEKLCRNSAHALSKEDLPGFERQKKLGAIVEAALKASPTRTRSSSRSAPRGLQNLFYEVVERAARDGYPKDRNAKAVNAFERTSEVLNVHKIKTTPAAVYNAWQKVSAEKNKLPSNSK